MAGPAPRYAPENSDDNQDPAWDSVEQWDYLDQQSAPYPGSRNPLVLFLSDVPDWSVLDKAALDKALQLEGLPVQIQFQCVQKIIDRMYRIQYRI
jgi:hypothetical protein